MSIIITQSENIPNTEDIESFQRRIGERLPGQYVKFLMKFGDGEPEQNGYFTNTQITVTHFLSIFLHNGSRSIERTFELLNSMDDTRMPRNFIPVAADDGGNFILLDLRDGSVWFWDHELDGLEPESPDDKP